MTECKSDRVKDHFIRNSRDLTPTSARYDAQLLYTPVSQDSDVTRSCASVLSDSELQRAGQLVKKGEKTLFIQRRAFRRFCAALALGSPQPLSGVVFNETEDGRPFLSGSPDTWFSFSSCRLGFVGAWSLAHGIGVDFEDQTRELNVSELARQFFSIAEAGAIERLDGFERRQAFFRLWSFKEAALKSIGQGLPFGLDAFEFELAPNVRIVRTPPDFGSPGSYNAHMIEGTGGCTAMVTRHLF